MKGKCQVRGQCLWFVSLMNDSHLEDKKSTQNSTPKRQNGQKTHHGRGLTDGKRAMKRWPTRLAGQEAPAGVIERYGALLLKQWKWKIPTTPQAGDHTSSPLRGCRRDIHARKWLGSFSKKKKTKHTLTLGPSITLPGIHPRGVKTHVHTHIHTCVPALFTGALSLVAKLETKIFFTGDGYINSRP